MLRLTPLAFQSLASIIGRYERTLRDQTPTFADIYGTMAYSKIVRERAIQLYREHGSAAIVLQMLRPEFASQDVPIAERTVRRWCKAERAKPSGQEPDSMAVAEGAEHFARMAEITGLLLANDVGKVGVIEGEYEDPNAEYAIVSDVSGYYVVGRNELIGMIEANIDQVVQQYSGWDLFDCFGSHLEAELEAEAAQPYELFEFLNASPGKFINTVRTMAARRTFKGSCPVCKDWQ